ncbi:LysR family transcriptional regulator [Aestuariirhabdus litorea]|uniref:LysR family transcriptional regulator n=1 Tax=Aestuariirhabdus litorea TaxID=2528527 RepID=A0A3P3VKD5_9GAMM|nr:LysR family transcriptional regulator [Aestuariirhabdus litorea]RRJ83195.1 LysR family transcriptional regulator [Aestuariirhabdus litorea]RWW93352.1 LysR family transcriptional regulator [Endozoicomonadaceae bacterium GTF-13]
MPQQRHFDLNLLRCFSVVYRTGSFTQAAAELDLTQSSVSNAIARLRQAIGEELFVRSGRGIQPTSAAHQLHEQLESPLLQIESALHSFERFDPLQSARTFQVYAMEPAIHQLQPLLDQRLKGAASRIVFRDMPSQESLIYDHLIGGKVDLLIDFIEPQQASLRSLALQQQPICCIARRGHPRIEGTLDREGYYREEHVIFNLRRQNITLADLLIRERLRPRRIYCEHGSLIGMLATVGRSNAIGVTSVAMARQYQESFGLQVLPLPFIADPVRVHLVWTARMEHHPAQQWLRTTLQQVAGQLETAEA